ncbi:hypothetical protein [Dyella sp.]|uniref:hypothetical protein n=1 Tax=Dyella sp. TaxID=1869338 RepID=UPI002D79022A|nr:hypothetical protein [Dyella sp.]HET7332344.1 hypothetical protein [Dyella sp.]
MNFNFRTIATVISLLPVVDRLVASTVQTVESALSGFNGNAKFAAAEAKVNSFLSSLSSDVAVVSQLQSSVGPLIQSWVDAFNVPGGLFGKPASGSATPTPAG